MSCPVVAWGDLSRHQRQPTRQRRPTRVWLSDRESPSGPGAAQGGSFAAPRDDDGSAAATDKECARHMIGCANLRQVACSKVVGSRQETSPAGADTASPAGETTGRNDGRGRGRCRSREGTTRLKKTHPKPSCLYLHEKSKSWQVLHKEQDRRQPDATLVLKVCR